MSQEENQEIDNETESQEFTFIEAINRIDSTGKGGEEVQVCKILDDNGSRCGQAYRNAGSSTGNLIAHLRDIHHIVNEDEESENTSKKLKKLRNTKITDFAKSHRPHPKHIQKQREESMLKWMLITDQPISTVTNPAYKEKISNFDPSFIIPGEQKIERLEATQCKLGYKDILHCIQDVSTRWNSSYYAWDRLFYLKDAIIQLQADLCTSTNRDDKKDGNKLRKIMLSEEEWELLDQLVDLLTPFERTTKDFSGGTYVTFSNMISIIKELIFNMTCSLPSNNVTHHDENTVFESKGIEVTPIEVEDEEVISNITNKRISIKDPLNTEGVLENVKENIYSSLIFYWDKPNDAGLIASLLDPRYKELDFVELEDDKNRIIQKLRDEFSNNFPNKSPQVIEFPNDSITPTQDTESSLRSYKEYRQRRQMKIKKVGRLNSGNNNSDELNNYLNMPAALEKENPLDWWRAHAQIFPKLSQIARKYLGIPATSVSSERLFSHANNLITVKRTRLDTDLAGKMLFLKRNLNSMQVFAKEWDEVEEM
ncbi:15597_t:CDS:2, partial [Rhizophagus irregularis]